MEYFTSSILTYSTYFNKLQRLPKVQKDPVPLTGWIVDSYARAQMLYVQLAAKDDVRTEQRQAQ